MADIDLPLWSVPPNWSTPVTERLDWLTDVMTSRSFSEQRRAIRLTPRRSFEFLINPTDRVRSYVDQWSHRIAANLMLLPLWHDIGKTTAGVVPTDVTIPMDTRWMEFEVGGLGVLYVNPFVHEVFEIDAITDTEITTVDGIAATWPKGTAVLPVRRVRLDPEVKLSNITSRVGGATMSFIVDSDNPLALDAEPLTIYEGFPLMTLEPNRLDALETQFNRVMDELDLQIGRVHRYDENDRSAQVQFYNWTARGREEHHKLRQSLYRLHGRQKGVWMPSFNQDIILSADLAAADTTASIENIGYDALGGVIAGRDHVVIRGDDYEYHPLKITSSAPISADEEQIGFSGAAGFDALAGSHGAFLSLVRMDQDSVEITHHTDSTGACEVSAAFRSFSPARVAPAILVQAPAEAVMGAEPCGVADNAPCPITAFDGWDYEFSALIQWNSHDAVPGFYIWPPPGGTGGNGTGGTIGSDWASTFAPPDSNSRWAARRINMGTPGGSPDINGVGTWNVYLDMGVVNVFGEVPQNKLQIYVYARHWSQSRPGSLVAEYHDVTANGPFNNINVSLSMDIDWRDYR